MVTSCGGGMGCMSGCGSVGKGVSYGRRLFAVAADAGRRLQGLAFLGKKGVVSNQVVVQQPVVIQSAVVSQPMIVHSQPAIVASQPQTICNDVSGRLGAGDLGFGRRVGREQGRI